jgi:thiamine biosynthesis lipoprotein
LRPTDQQIAARLDAVDYRHVVLDRARRTIFFKAQGVRINLGGIAKGYVVERAAAMLRSSGVEHAILNAGGDSRVIGDRRGQPWIVGIRHPRAADEVVTRLPLVDEAISTSGDYERYFEENGRRYHHIINPATGRPTEGILTVTVIGPDGTLTDGLGTAIFVLGVERGLKLIESYPDYETIIVDAAGKVSYSKGLMAPN